MRMGAAILIPLVMIALLAVGYVVWALISGAWGTASAARQGKSADETAPHYEERGTDRNISTTPPDED